jgi:hypothetical protein
MFSYQRAIIFHFSLTFCVTSVYSLVISLPLRDHNLVLYRRLDFLPTYTRNCTCASGDPVLALSARVIPLTTGIEA